MSEVLHRRFLPPAVHLAGELRLVLPRGLSEKKWPPEDPMLCGWFSHRVLAVGGSDSGVDHGVPDSESELGSCWRLYLVYCTRWQVMISISPFQHFMIHVV